LKSSGKHQNNVIICWWIFLIFGKLKEMKQFFAKIGKVVVVNKHVITDVVKIFSIGWKEQKQVDKQIAKTMFQNIIFPSVSLVENNHFLTKMFSTARRLQLRCNWDFLIKK
jgi:hypothetical protein